MAIETFTYPCFSAKTMQFLVDLKLVWILNYHLVPSVVPGLTGGRSRLAFRDHKFCTSPYLRIKGIGNNNSWQVDSW